MAWRITIGRKGALGATLALPVTRSQSIKIYGITGYNGHRHHDFDAVGIAWQYRWGGGL
jgi:hypothetical protein